MPLRIRCRTGGSGTASDLEAHQPREQEEIPDHRRRDGPCRGLGGGDG
ncbi:MAG: hypothetical protein MZV70_13850 [Desulfobacterales bacterium]|nr:hypothetical protein [Desulfobacterales bacterium]